MGSLLLHAGIVAVTIFTWTHRLDIVDLATPVVPVDLVTVADKTNIAPMTTVQPKPIEEQPVTAPIPLSLQPPKLEVAPDAKPAQKPAKFDINDIQALLAKRQETVAKNAKIGTQNLKGVGLQNAMTADLRAMLQSEIYRCWSPPVGAPHPEKLIVSFDLYLNRDGSVAQQPQLTADSGAAAASDPYMRAAAEAARRAIYTCAPYKLPADRYNQWHAVTFIFDPRTLMGQ
jgi:hypothetical protein